MTTMKQRLTSTIVKFGSVLRAFLDHGRVGGNLSILLALMLAPARAAEPPADVRRPLVLLVSRFDNPQRDFAAITLASMCQQAGVDFDAYYAADHQEGGMFSAHVSSVIGGQHGLRIARALAQFDTTAVRLDDTKMLDSLIRTGARKAITATSDLPGSYEAMPADLNAPDPALAVYDQHLNAFRKLLAEPDADRP